MHRMRKYKPVELPLKAVPDELADVHAVCPNCLDRDAGVIGRLGLRLYSSASDAVCASTGRPPWWAWSEC